MLDSPACRPSLLTARRRIVAGAAAAAAVTVALPLTAHAQSSVPPPFAGAVNPGSVNAGSVDTGSLGTDSLGSLGSQEPQVPPEPLPPGPEVTVEPVHGGLTIPWDVVRDPEGVVVTGERDSGNVYAIDAEGTPSLVDVDLGALFTGGESGLMGIELAEDFATSREVYTCHSYSDGDVHENRITAWEAADDWSALESPEVIVPDIALQNIGYHSGCRILAHPDGTLYIGTGDTFRGSVPQDLDSLGGKVLHVDRDGTPADDTINDSPILTYGHRNVQGLALQPGTDRIFSAEHGTDRDDEINLLQSGGNYGWDPYNPNVERNHDDTSPMTDLDEYPDAIEATWSSGHPTLATGGIAFLDDPSWGEWNGALAVAMLKTKQIVLMQLSDDGTNVTELSSIIPGEHGRIRSLTAEPGGTLLATTSNGEGIDEVVRISPAQATQE